MTYILMYNYDNIRLIKYICMQYFFCMDRRKKGPVLAACTSSRRVTLSVNLGASIEP